MGEIGRGICVVGWGSIMWSWLSMGCGGMFGVLDSGQCYVCG